MFANEQLGILNEGHKCSPFFSFYRILYVFYTPSPNSPHIHCPLILTPLCVLPTALPRPICSVQTFLDVWPSTGGLTGTYTFRESSLLSPSTEDLPIAAQLGVEVYAQLLSPCQGFCRLGLAQVLHMLSLPLCLHMCIGPACVHKTQSPFSHPLLLALGLFLPSLAQ